MPPDLTPDWPREFEERADQLRESVYRFLVGFGIPRSEAEVLAQDTMIAAQGGIHSFEGISKIETWVIGIAINKARKYRSKASRRGCVSYIENIDDAVDSRKYSDPAVVAEQSSEIPQLRARIRDALENLSNNQRWVIQLKCYENMKHSQIAEIMGVRPSVVKEHLKRARQKLKKTLGSYWREFGDPF